MADSFVELSLAEAVDIVALSESDTKQSGEPERCAEVVKKVIRLSVVGGFFFLQKYGSFAEELLEGWMLRHRIATASGMGSQVRKPEFNRFGRLQPGRGRDLKNRRKTPERKLRNHLMPWMFCEKKCL